MPTRKVNGGDGLKKLVGGVEAPPGHAPAVPTGWTPGGRAKHVPTEQQVRDADDMARELTESKSYGVDFGAHAPAKDALAAQLSLAKAWSDEAVAAKAWSVYAAERRDRAWDVALASAADLQVPFGNADQHDPTIATRYPQTKDFLGVRTKAAQKAAVTRANNKKKRNGQPQPA